MNAMSQPDTHRFDDLFQSFGPISIRRFFGGEGIYAEEMMIGMVFDEKIFLRTDENTRKPFIAEGSTPFTFKKRSTGETVVTGWYAVPDRLYDEPEEFARWARIAFEVVMASATVQKKVARKNPKKKSAKRPSRD